MGRGDNEGACGESYHAPASAVYFSRNAQRRSKDSRQRMITGAPSHLLASREVPRLCLGRKLLKELSAAEFTHRFLFYGLPLENSYSSLSSPSSASTSTSSLSFPNRASSSLSFLSFFSSSPTPQELPERLGGCFRSFISSLTRVIWLLRERR